MNPDWLSVVLRALGFVCLFQAAGTVCFLALFGHLVGRSRHSIRRLGWYSALAGVPLLAARQWLQAARMADDYAGLFDPSLQRLAWSGSGASAAFLQIAGLCMIALALARQARSSANLAALGALVATCAFALTGHTSDQPQRALLAALLCIHLLLMSFWFGALLPLIICSRHETRSDALALLRSFSGVAGWLVPCIAVAGLSMALVLIPALEGWRAVYGLLLLGKAAAFAVLLLLAAWNRWRTVPTLALASGAPPTGSPASAPEPARTLRRTIAIEYLLMLAVFATTAVLTSFYGP